MRSRREQPCNGRHGRPDFEDLLATLDVPDPFDIQVFCDRLAAQRGRALYLHPVPGISGTDAPCGVWIATENADHLFYEAVTSPLHQVHIILHEIAHMLLGHQSIIDGVQSLAAGGLFADIDPATVVSMLTRASYATEDERDAERVAGLIAGKAAARDSRTARSSVLQRLGDALSDS